MTKINGFTLGIGKAVPSLGGSGQMYFDTIALYPPRYVPGLVTPPATDLTDDGKVNHLDVEALTGDWLDSDGELQPLLAHYKLDGDFLDSSGNGFHATAMGTAPAPAFVTGTLGQAAQFLGGGDYIEAAAAGPVTNGLSAFSATCWIKPDYTAATDDGFFIMGNPAGNDDRDMRYDSSGANSGGTAVLKFGLMTTDGRHQVETASNTQSLLGAWQHVAMTWASGAEMVVYLDGVAVVPASIEDIRNGTLTGNTTLIIGKGGKGNAADRSWQGLIDDVRVYSKQLTADNIFMVTVGALPDVGDPTYTPLTSAANFVPKVGDVGVYNPANMDVINFDDLAVMASEFGENPVWP